MWTCFPRINCFYMKGPPSYFWKRKARAANWHSLRKMWLYTNIASIRHRVLRSCDGNYHSFGNYDRLLSSQWIIRICSGDCSSVLWLVKIKQMFIISVILSYDLTMVQRKESRCPRLKTLRKWCVIGTIIIPFKNCQKISNYFILKLIE